jgi:nucleoid-associated protein YgaU
MSMPGLDAAVGIGVGVAAIMGARIPAMLRCTTPPNIGLVLFDFNPDKVTMSRSSRTATVPTPPRSGTASLTGRGQSSRTPTKALDGSQIKLSKITFNGPMTKFFCDQLLTWMQPNAGFAAMVGFSGFSSQPANLTFQWGPPMVGFMYQCKLTNVSVTYTRFSAIGIPLRAEVDLQLLETPTIFGSMPTNPTSGGLPGRRSHTVADGESLQSIATEKYGKPGLWRKIAEVNNITDPARVRPGKTIYLPNPDELTGALS